MKIRGLLFTVLLISLTSFTRIYAGDSLSIHSRNIWENILYDADHFIKDGAAFYTLSVRFGERQWLFAGGGLVGLGLIISQDKNLKEVLSKGENKSIWSDIKNYGDVKYAGIGSGAIYLTGLLSGNQYVRETGRMLLQSLVYSGSITILMKTIFGRARPYASENQYSFNWFENKEENLSFPSGHSTVAFAVSTVLAEKIGTWWSRAGFYTLAALTAYSRVHDNQHWVSDAVLGGLIGFGSGYFVVHLNDKSSKFRNFSFTPFSRGLILKYLF